MRADRLDDRTAENVAIANTSVPAPVAKEEIVTQSTARRTIIRQSGSLLPPIVQRDERTAGFATDGVSPAGHRIASRQPGMRNS